MPSNSVRRACCRAWLRRLALASSITMVVGLSFLTACGAWVTHDTVTVSVVD
jgi:hypothetical protein